MDHPHGDPTSAKPHLDARTTAWFLAQRERTRELELEAARLRGQLDASERIERSAQRYADRLEEKLEAGRRREASLARAVGYLEAQRDQLAVRLGRGAEVAALVDPGELPPVARSRAPERGAARRP